MSAALAKIHIARKETGIHEDDYRAMLERLTGQNSAKDLTDTEIGRVLEEFKRMGWKPKLVYTSKRGTTSKVTNGAKRAPASHPTAKKARALWISLYQLGVVRDSSEKALESFARAQLKCERMAWADQQQMFKLIEALKAMAERAGWSQSLVDVRTGMEIYILKRRLVEAQFKTLLGAEAARPFIRELGTVTEGRLNELAGELAKEIRDANPLPSMRGKKGVVIVDEEK